MITARNFQQAVAAWMISTFKPAHITDVKIRSHRFLEEAAELAQCTSCTREEAHRIIDYVYSRPMGDAAQETGGTAVTLAALASALKIDLDWCSDAELRRCNLNIEKIRARQDEKPDFTVNLDKSFGELLAEKQDCANTGIPKKFCTCVVCNPRA